MKKIDLKKIELLREVTVLSKIIDKIDLNNVLYEEDLIDLMYLEFSKHEYEYLSDEYYELCLNKFREVFPEVDFFKRTKWLRDNDLANGIQLEKSHAILYKVFDEFNKMIIENNIEGYYTSGILSYLLVGKELQRYHHDLDIFVNMDDLKKLEEISQSYGFSFVRKLGDRPDGTERRVLKMYYLDIDIPITVFMYKRFEDNSIIQYDYFYDENNQLYVERMYNSPEIVKLSFSDSLYYHNDIPYKAITLEALYLSKMGNRKKDIYDCSIMKPYINNELLKRLKEAFKINLPNTTSLVESEDELTFMKEKTYVYKK